MLGKRKKTGQEVRSFHRIGHPIKHKKSSNHVDKTLLPESVETDGILVDDELLSDLQQVVNNKSDHESVFEDDEFKRAFWDQQVTTYAILMELLYLVLAMYAYVLLYFHNVRFLHVKQKRMGYDGTLFSSDDV